MNAVRSDLVDWRDVLTGQIRAIQDAYPIAHEALKDWGLWSSYRSGLMPRGIVRPFLWQMATPSKFSDFADEEEGKDQAQAARAQAQGEAKNEGQAREAFSERVAVEMDIRIHKDDFPPIWRRCLKTAYVHRVPEYQWPSRSRCGQTGFLMFFESGLSRLQRAME